MVKRSTVERPKDVDSVVAIIEACGFNSSELFELHKRIGKMQRALVTKTMLASAKCIQPGDTVEFHSRKYNMPIQIVVSSIGRTGVVKGEAASGVGWRVSASLCKVIKQGNPQ